MARPLKKGLDYFPLDCTDNDSIELIIAKHGLEGYGAIVQLWKKIYKIEGYFTDWTEKNLLIFARNYGVDVDNLRRIVETAISEGIFDARLAKDEKVLTSAGIQSRFMRIVTDSKRKDIKIESRFDCLHAGKPLFTPEETPKGAEFTPEESTQSIVKNNILENNKELLVLKKIPSTAGAASGEKNIIKGKKEKADQAPLPFWQITVDRLFKFWRENLNGEEPTFKGRPSAQWREIVELLITRARKKEKAWSEKYASDAVDSFLAAAYSDKWRKDRFTIKILREQYDAIIVQAREKIKPVQQKSAQQLFKEELAYLVIRYQEPGFLPEWIPGDMYRKMIDEGIFKLNHSDKFTGDTREAREREAVLDWIKFQIN